MDEQATYCAYCGERFPLDDHAASAVTEHINTCEKHPMRIPERQQDGLLAALEALLVVHREHHLRCSGWQPEDECWSCIESRTAIAKARGG